MPQLMTAIIAGLIAMALVAVFRTTAVISPGATTADYLADKAACAGEPDTCMKAKGWARQK